MTMDGLLPIPRAKSLVEEAFTGAAEFDEDAVYPTNILKSAAGLVHAYYRYIHSELCDNTDDPTRPYLPAVSSPSFSNIDNEDAVRTVEEIYGYIRTINIDAHEALSSARPSTRAHHEGFGEAVAGLAYLYVLAHPENATTGRTASPGIHLLKKRFKKECLIYDRMVRELMAGNLCLPPVEA